MWFSVVTFGSPRVPHLIPSSERHVRTSFSLSASEPLLCGSLTHVCRVPVHLYVTEFGHFLLQICRVYLMIRVAGRAPRAEDSSSLPHALTSIMWVGLHPGNRRYLDTSAEMLRHSRTSPTWSWTEAFIACWLPLKQKQNKNKHTHAHVICPCCVLFTCLHGPVSPVRLRTRLSQNTFLTILAHRKCLFYVPVAFSVYTTQSSSLLDSLLMTCV